MKQKLLSILEAVLIALAVLAGAIALPVLCRPFFHLHIAPLALTARAGLTAEEIKAAYGEMMDYCIGLTDTFSAGVLPFSESGASHFADVRRLFVLDLWVLAVAGAALLALKVACRKQNRRLARHTPGFWSAVGLGVTFVTVGCLAALDFNAAFTVFHEIFFPGKDNWVFDGRTDPIIYMLPAEFFRNCALLILGVILLACAALVVWDLYKRKKAP